jgi:Tol biopolymer transport system component
MLSSRRQDPILHSSHSVIRLLVVLALSGVLGACSDTDSPLAPGGADEALVTADEASQASAPEALITALTSPRIAFSSYRNSNNDIYLMDPQGYQVKRMTTPSTWEGSPSWSWDNKRIALVRPRKDASNVTHYDIYLINADGTNGHWARSTPSPYNLAAPSWHPDGSHIMVTITAQDGRWYVGWLHLATGTIGNFAIGGQPVLGKQPSYDATGQRIVYVSTSSYKYSLDVVNANGSGHVTLLSASGSNIDGPAFSPDGKRIAFSNTAGNGDQEIFVKSLVDGSVKRLTYSTGTDLWPSWSPDGTKIVFSSTRNGQLQIWSMSATGGRATRISHNSYAERTPAYSH